MSAIMNVIGKAWALIKGLGFRTKVEAGLVAAGLAVIATFTLQLHNAEAARDRAITERDSFALEAVSARADADGWSTQFATVQGDLWKVLASRDTLSERLAKTIRDAGARVAALTDIVVSLRDSLTSVGTPTDTSALGVVTYRGTLDDGLLSGTWRFAQPDLSLAYKAAVPVEIVTSRAGRRWLITARATDPRASVTVGDYWVDPEPPITVDRCTLRQRATAAGAGSLVGLVLGLWLGR